MVRKGVLSVGIEAGEPAHPLIVHPLSVLRPCVSSKDRDASSVRALKDASGRAHAGQLLASLDYSYFPFPVSLTLPNLPATSADRRGRKPSGSSHTRDSTSRALTINADSARKLPHGEIKTRLPGPRGGAPRGGLPCSADGMHRQCAAASRKYTPDQNLPRSPRPLFFAPPA